MNYSDVYFSRINHLGTTTAERIRNGGIRSFEKWMAESPHTIRQLSTEKGLFFDGIILTSKDKQYQKIMFLNVSNNIPLTIGDIVNWTLDDGSIEKWLIFQEEKKVNGTYRTFWIVRCNYLLKWIDSLGHLQQSWGYVVSSVDSKIKGNFRTWNSLITPQPNKYAEILIPRYAVDRATNFIIEDESWTVVEYDHTSVPGVIYLSLTENKVNLIYDDLQNDIADTDKLANYTISAPAETETFSVGSIIEPVFTLMKNGKPCQEEVQFISSNNNIVKIIDNQLHAMNVGECNIVVRLKQYPSINCILHIQINDNEVFSAYIEGASTIKLDRESTYILKTTKQLTDSDNIIFTVNSDLVRIIKINNNECIIRANDKNKLGNFTLSAQLRGEVYTKDITIIPLW